MSASYLHCPGCNRAFDVSARACCPHCDRPVAAPRAPEQRILEAIEELAVALSAATPAQLQALGVSLDRRLSAPASGVAADTWRRPLLAATYRVVAGEPTGLVPFDGGALERPHPPQVASIQALMAALAVALWSRRPRAPRRVRTAPPALARRVGRLAGRALAVFAGT